MIAPADVAVVGGGPAGAATAAGLARRGYRVVVFERHAASRWHACGVFTTPLVRNRLTNLGMDAEQIAGLHQHISELRLDSTGGATCTLEYKRGFACGFDRTRLDQALLDLAANAGAEVHRACVVRDVMLPAAGSPAVVRFSSLDGRVGPGEVEARVVVGADGGRSRVAQAADAVRERNWLGRAGITFHVSDPRAAEAVTTGRFVLGHGWYVGLAPVPGRRVNVGIVVPTRRLSEGVEEIIDGVLATASTTGERWQSAGRTDVAQVAGRLEHHVSRAAGDGWLLVGDAIEFVDPLTGEGLHRALLSADLAAEAIHRQLAGDRGALAVYDRRVRTRFRSKNVLSLVLQAFIVNPRVLDYALRRLDRRASLRDELTAVLADQERASTALDPRFIARLLAP